jgi:hypothetical protein
MIAVVLLLDELGSWSVCYAQEPIDDLTPAQCTVISPLNMIFHAVVEHHDFEKSHLIVRESVHASSVIRF